jgi:hypothetical protein
VRGAGVTIGVKVSEGTILMTMNDSSSAELRGAAVEKKPYEKPGFRYEHVFVTSALACTKTGTEAQCGNFTTQKLS